MRAARGERSVRQYHDLWLRVVSGRDRPSHFAHAFLDKVKDRPGHGVYLDPPFPGPGDDYRHKFTEADQRKLAARLAEFRECKVVCRFYDHELIRELYPESLWAWHRPEGGRTQANKPAPEVLIVNRIPTGA